MKLRQHLLISVFISVVKDSTEVVSVDRLELIAEEIDDLNKNVLSLKESFSDAHRVINDKLTVMSQKLEILLPSRLMAGLKNRNMNGPSNIVRSQGEDDSEDDDDDDDEEEDYSYSKVEDEMINLFRKITVPLRRVRQRKFTVEKIENDVAAVKAGMERANDELRRSMTDLVTSSAEIAQEQNHMIEGVSSTLASVLQLSSDHSQAFYQFISSSTPALEKLDSAVGEVKMNFVQKMNRLEQQMEYNMITLRENIKVLENVVVEGFDRQWNCGQGRRRTTSAVSTTTRRTTQSSTRTTTIRTTTTTVTTTHSSTITTSTTTAYDDINSTVEADVESCWHHKQRNPRSITGVYNIDGTRVFCDMDTEGGGWMVNIS